MEGVEPLSQVRPRTYTSQRLPLAILIVLLTLAYPDRVERGLVEVSSRGVMDMSKVFHHPVFKKGIKGGSKLLES